MTDLNRAGPSRGQLLRDAVLTFTAVLFAFAAFDDITTDTATTFTFEWLGLGLCAAWLLIVSWRLVRASISGSARCRLSCWLSPSVRDPQ
jgi:hypothetical protein